MESIRTYQGEMFLCAHCGQPAYQSDEVGNSHFSEQWDGVHCPRFPLSGPRVEIEWDQMSRQTLQQSYPNTYPKVSFSAS
jgi:hypothetical protein